MRRAGPPHSSATPFVTSASPMSDGQSSAPRSSAATSRRGARAMKRSAAWYSEIPMVPWILFGYVLGSVPFAFLVARRAGIDVRVAGSGNVGAANVLRTTRARLGLAVMALDISKGAAAVLVAYAGAATIGSM